MQMGRRLKIVLIVVGIIIVAMIGFAGWAYMDVMKYKDLDINEVDLASIADGSYEGTFDGGRFSNSVEVTVSDHKIVDIKKQGRSGPQGEVYQGIYAKVIEKQSVKIDTVSGASVTTLTTLKAIENALSK